MEEKRKEKRFEEENRVLIELTSIDKDTRMKKAINAFTIDISVGGARILTDTSFPVGAEIELTLFLSSSKQIIKIKGKVKWIAPFQNEDLYEIGMKFEHRISNTILALILHIYDKEKGILAKNRNKSPKKSDTQEED